MKWCFIEPDEVGAVVLDIGSFSIRGGYAGEDMPKVMSCFFYSQRLLLLSILILCITKYTNAYLEAAYY